MTDKPVCPDCGGADMHYIPLTVIEKMAYQCRACGRLILPPSADEGGVIYHER